jgi:hypothetical protein
MAIQMRSAVQLSMLLRSLKALPQHRRAAANIETSVIEFIIMVE